MYPAFIILDFNKVYSIFKPHADNNTDDGDVCGSSCDDRGDK